MGKSHHIRFIVDNPEMFFEALRRLCLACYEVSKDKGFWDEWDELSEEMTKYFIGTKLALVHSEVTEALEELRMRGLDTDESREEFTKELADVIIRCFDLAGSLQLNLPDVLIEKLLFNASRPVMHGGKRF